MFSWLVNVYIDMVMKDVKMWMGRMDVRFSEEGREWDVRFSEEGREWRLLVCLFR